MKKIVSLLFLFALAIPSLFSQTQQGYTKTLGRPEKRGEALSGVTIFVKGEHNAVVSNTDGLFSIPMPQKRNGDLYALEQVRKKGYVLANNELIDMPLTFSDKTRLEIALVSLEQLQDEKQRIENKAYTTIQNKYKSKYGLLERQLANNIITIEKYQEELLSLKSNLENNQLLIDNIADHYARIDFDTLSEKGKEIILCIENGELERADSLIHLIFDPASALERDMRALATLDQQIKEAEEGLEQAKADWDALLRQQKTDAEHFYQLYTIALLSYDNEKARFNIESRAALDTTNVEWQIEAGLFNQNILADYDKALSYYESAISSASPTNEYTQEWMVLANGSICSIKYLQGFYAETYIYGTKAMEILSEHPETINPTATAYAINNVSASYFGIGEYDKALELHSKALELCRQDEEDNAPLIATLYNNIAIVLSRQGRYDEALEYYHVALEKRKASNDYLLGQTYNNIGDIYHRKNNPDKALEYFKKGLEIRKKFFKENHPDVAQSYSNIGAAFNDKKEPDSALFYCQKALSIYDKTNCQNLLDAAKCHENIGNAFFLKETYDSAFVYLNHALEISEAILPPIHQDLADIYFSLGLSYLFATTQNAFRALDYLPLSEEYLNKALDIFNTVMDENSHEATMTHAYLGMTYEAQNKNEEAIEHYLSSFSSSDNDYDKYNKHKKIGYLYYIIEDYVNALSELEEARYHLIRSPFALPSEIKDLDHDIADCKKKISKQY